jgi:hypothetical protein
MYGKKYIQREISLRNLKVRDPLEDLGLDGRIKMDLKYNRMVAIGLVRPKTGTSDRPL